MSSATVGLVKPQPPVVADVGGGIDMEPPVGVGGAGLKRRRKKKIAIDGGPVKSVKPLPITPDGKPMPAMRNKMKDPMSEMMGGKKPQIVKEDL